MIGMRSYVIKQMDMTQFALLLGRISLVMTAFFAPLSVTGTNIAMTATAIFSLLSGQFVKQYRLFIRNNPLVWIVLLMVFLVALGTLWSIGSWSERLSSLHKYAKLLYIPFLIPFCVDKYWRNLAINLFLLAMSVTVALSYYKAYLGLSLGQPGNAGWLFHSHIETSYFVSLATFIFVDRAWKKVRFSWIYVALALLFTYQEFFINEGRTGWISYLFLTILFFIQRINPDPLSQIPQHWKKRLTSLLKGSSIGICCAILICVLSSYFSSGFRDNMDNWLQFTQDFFSSNTLNMSHADQDSSSDYFRINFVQLSMELIKNHPLTGLGTGSFPQAYKLSKGVPGWGEVLNNPHSDYLFIMTQLGIIGLALLLFLFYKQWRLSFKLTENRQIAQAFLLSFMLGSLFNSFLYTSVTGHFYVLFTALLFTTRKT